MVGRLLGNRYKIIRELGSGGMARVYLAKDNKKLSLVAVKILYPQLCENFTYIQRFNREAKMAMGLSSPYIVGVLDYGADKDDHYLVMEYVEGKTLAELMREEGPLPWGRALAIAYEAAQALREAHRHRIIHRDIKPANMMITPQGTARVLDFGIARASDLPALTQSGFVGSPYYISPEQAMGEKVDIRSDIYSLGVVLYEMLSNRLPFDAETPWPVIEQHISAKPPALGAICPDLPQEVELLVDRMLAKDPEERFQTPAELMHAIEVILPDVVLSEVVEEAESTVGEEIEARLPAPSLRARSFGTRSVVLLIVVVALVLTGTLFAYRFSVLPGRDCSAYLEEGLSALEAFWESQDAQHLEEALAQFNRGLGACPNDATLSEEQYLANLYLQGIGHYEGENWQQAIASFEEIRDRRPDYGGAHLANLLYSAYLDLGYQYYQEGDLEGALEQYEAALRVDFSDSTDAQQKRDEVMAAIEASQGTPTPTRTSASTPTPIPTWIPPTPTATLVALKYPAPQLIDPANHHPFGERFTPTLEWELVDRQLEAGECYRVSIFTTYNSDPYWWGSEGCLRETAYPVPGFLASNSDTHEFTWFVWISLDQQDDSGQWIRLSPDSEQRTFYWEPPDD